MKFPKEPLRALPAPVVTTSERGLSMVVSVMLQQHGPAGAYNLLVDSAEQLRAAMSRQSGRPGAGPKTGDD